MRKLLTGTTAALVAAGTMLAATAPAEARYYHGGYYGRGYGDGAAIGAGILGLAVGAAIASDRPRYYEGPAYYAPPPPPPGAYYGGYGYARCHSDWRWDGYRGRYVPVRYCD